MSRSRQGRRPTEGRVSWGRRSLPSERRRLRAAAAADRQAVTLDDIPRASVLEPVRETSAAALRLLKIRAFPAGAVAHKEGSGILIAPKLLLTAGHVVHDPDAFGGLAQRVELSSPFLAAGGAAAASADITAHPEWVSNRDRGSDLALIVLAAAWPGADSFAPMALATDDMAQRRMWAFGYPKGESRPFHSAGGCVDAIADLLYHTANVEEGQSGGPILFRIGNSIALGGVHRASPSETPPRFGASNGAVRLTAAKLAWIQTIGENL